MYCQRKEWNTAACKSWWTQMCCRSTALQHLQDLLFHGSWISPPEATAWSLAAPLQRQHVCLLCATHVGGRVGWFCAVKQLLPHDTHAYDCLTSTRKYIIIIMTPFTDGSIRFEIHVVLLLFAIQYLVGYNRLNVLVWYGVVKKRGRLQRVDAI